MTKISKVIETLMETKSVLGDIDIEFPKVIKKPKDFNLIEEIRKFAEFEVFYSSPKTISSYPQYSIQRIGMSAWPQKTHYSVNLIAKDFFGSSLPLKKDIEKVFKGLADNLNVLIKSEVKTRNLENHLLSYYFEVLV
jgi:hypothetical protein